jgi:hypothetical protein
MFCHLCFFLFRSRATFASEARSSNVRSICRVLREIRSEKNKRNDPEPNEGTYNRSGHRDSTAKKLVYGNAKISDELTGRPVMPAPQSNLMAPWLRKVIQQTMVANARARPTSGQTRSNAVNTPPHPSFLSLPFGGCLQLRRLSDGRRVCP